MGRIRHVELAVQPRVARRILVDAGGAVAEPLPGDEDRRLDVELELAHLEWRGVAVAQEIADQRPVLPHLARACAVGNPRRLHDGRVVAHVVDHPDEAVIEHVEALVEDRLHGRHRDAPGLLRGSALGLDLRPLVVVDRHGVGGPRWHDSVGRVGCRASLGRPLAAPYWPLPLGAATSYISWVGGRPSTMAINAARNNRCGPGGSTRRLHHPLGRRPALRGRTRIDVRGKGVVFARHGTAVIGPTQRCE